MRLLQSLDIEFNQQDTLIKLHDGQEVTIHSVEVLGDAATDVPLVFIPGYGTGAAIFGRCWAQLLSVDSVDSLKRPLIAIDLLGFFLSSHPRWTPGTDVEKAEAWFVQSLEAWRQARGLEHMDLLGHSIGGNVAATYAESYPAHVRTLVLLSPAGLVGMPDDYHAKLRQASRRVRLVIELWRRGWTPFTALRLLPHKRAYRICKWNARRWSGLRPRDSDEEAPSDDPVVAALADYIYHGWREGPASADGAIAALLHPGAWGKKPLSPRLPRLPISRIEFIYGTKDWMDFRHGNKVAEACMEQRTPTVQAAAQATAQAPLVCVQVVEDAGHYAHLENVPGFTHALRCALTPREEQLGVTAPVPEGYADRFSGPRVPAWRNWEGYDFGR